MTAAQNTIVSDDLGKVIPTTTSMHVAGEDIPVRQFKVGQLPRVLAAVQPIAYLLVGRGVTPTVDVYSLVTAHTDDSLTLLAVLANKPRAWVDELDIDDAVSLLTVLVEVNLDFFIQSVLPKLADAVTRLGQTAKANAQAMQMIGQTVFNSSSKTATT